ncbi:MAG: homoserine kinase [Planctomycetota bacterium]|nr:homoserine kinase [Planctomycetota bacterium]MEC8511013.1 homoserine kinase [Planctomycetota bacterium]
MSSSTDTSERAPALRLDVPASTSNLGPGFDFLGLSLGLWLRVRARQAAGREPGAHRLRWADSGEDRGEDDLLLRAIRAGEARRGSFAPAMDLDLDSEIPVGRGFGSSGAAVAAGLLLEAAFAGDHEALETRERALLPDALRLEGHPDNATASLLGGCTLGVPHDSGLTVVRQPVHPDLGFAVAWPERPLFTEEARAALPDQVSFADAVENPRRLALLLEGLRTADPELLALGTADRLHERFRRALIPGSDRACAEAMEAGAATACLSGAGSGLVALGPIERMPAAAEALARSLEGGQGRAVAHVTSAPVPMWDMSP